MSVRARLESRLGRLSFRNRLTLVAAVALLAAITATSVVVFAAVRIQLRDRVDEELVGLASEAEAFTSPFGGTFLLLPRGTLGGQRGLAQFVTPRGPVESGAGGIEGPPGASRVIPYERNAVIPISERTLEVAAGRSEAFFEDSDIGSVHARIYTAPLSPGLAVQVAQPLAGVDQTLARLGVLLFVVALGGLAVAILLGRTVAQAALGPVRSMTRTAEEVSSTGDLTRRIEVSGGDELARLARSFNEMLGALEESLQSQRRLVADASHELRTPITSVRTNIEVLQRRPDLDPQQRQEILHDVVGQLEELTGLIGGLIELARGAEPTLSFTEVRLDELTFDAVERARRLYPTVRFALTAEPSVVRAVPDRLERAISNLLDNAAKWSPEGGTVDVHVARGEVSVRDGGPGIDPADRDRIFDRFYRAASARGTPGSGLGLAIVRDVAAAHGGRVEVSAAPGGGSTFVLQLPAAD